MLEALDIASTISGGLLGGVFRLIPEALKWLDRKNERAHEFAMFDRQCALEELRGQQRLQEIGAQADMAIDSGMVTAFDSAIQQQAIMAKAAGGWAATLSATVRPIVTYWVWVLYSAALITLMVMTWKFTKDPVAVANVVLTPAFMALLSGITNFWFMDRMLAKRGLM